MKDLTMRDVVEKEFYCVAIFLLSTILGLLAIGLFDGILNIAGAIDATVTTCCLVVIASPIHTN